MTQFNQHLVRAIVDVAIFLEFTDEALLNADTSVNAMEQLAAELQKIDPPHLAQLCQDIRKIALEYEADKADFVSNLPTAFGLE